MIVDLHRAVIHGSLRTPVGSNRGETSCGLPYDWQWFLQIVNHGPDDTLISAGYVEDPPSCIVCIALEKP